LKILLSIMVGLLFLCLFVVPVEGAEADDLLVDLERIEGDSSVERAVEISRKGWDTSSVVVLVRSGESADALSAAPLAHKYGAPVLFTETEELDDITKEEIERLKAKRVIILGGELAISFNVELDLRSLDLEIERIWGSNRFETAARVAQELEPFDKAVIVNGDNFPDALSIGPHAARRGYPILLTRKDSLPTATSKALEGIEETILVGGTSTISPEVEEKLPGSVRIAEEDRYRTSVEVSQRFSLDRRTLYISDGKEFKEALPGSVLAARGNHPLLLVEKNSLDKEGIQSLVESFNGHGYPADGETTRVVILAEGEEEEKEEKEKEIEEVKVQEEVQEREASFTQRGTASWYGSKFHGRRTASGEVYDQNAMTAAHRTLPFGTRVNVKYLATGEEVTVRINDRGPHISGRIIDLSRAAAERIGLAGAGLGEVKLTVYK